MNIVINLVIPRKMATLKNVTDGDFFLGTKIPILGICRGHQILNVALGGNLYQDLSEIPIDVNTHR